MPIKTKSAATATRVDVESLGEWLDANTTQPTLKAKYAVTMARISTGWRVSSRRVPADLLCEIVERLRAVGVEVPARFQRIAVPSTKTSPEPPRKWRERRDEYDWRQRLGSKMPENDGRMRWSTPSSTGAEYLAEVTEIRRYNRDGYVSIEVLHVGSRQSNYTGRGRMKVLTERGIEYLAAEVLYLTHAAHVVDGRIEWQPTRRTRDAVRCGAPDTGHAPENRAEIEQRIRILLNA